MHITWWNVDNDEVCKSYETLYSIECLSFLLLEFSLMCPSYIFSSQDINLSQHVYLNKLTITHVKLAASQNTTFTVNFMSCWSVCVRMNKIHQRSVEGGAHTIFWDVRTDKCKPKFPPIIKSDKKLFCILKITLH